MAVMVTGASGLLGRAAIPALLRRNQEVRAAVRRSEVAEEIRALGAKVTVGRLDDAGALADACSGVFTLVHLVGGPNQPDRDELLAANHGSVLTALAAAKLAGVRRFVLVSWPGASPGAEHPFLRAKGLAEEAVTASGLEHAIVRVPFPYGVGGFWFTVTIQAAAAGFVIGDGTNRLAPVYAEDVGTVLAAIDDRAEEVRGMWGLEGPDATTMLQLYRRLGGKPPPERPAPDEAAARLGEMLGVHISSDALRLFAGAVGVQEPDAAAEFGISRTPLEAGFQQTIERAGLGG